MLLRHRATLRWGWRRSPCGGSAFSCVVSCVAPACPGRRFRRFRFCRIPVALGGLAMSVPLPGRPRFGDGRAGDFGSRGRRSDSAKPHPCLLSTVGRLAKSAARISIATTPVDIRDALRIWHSAGYPPYTRYVGLSGIPVRRRTARGAPIARGGAILFADRPNYGTAAGIPCVTRRIHCARSTSLLLPVVFSGRISRERAIAPARPDQLRSAAGRANGQPAPPLPSSAGRGHGGGARKW